MKSYAVLIQLRWRNPYTEPPNGLRVLAEIYRHADDPESRKSPAEFDELSRSGDGYSPYLTFPALMPARELPPESLASVRKKRTARRIEKKYPLFAEQFIAETIARQPEYYAGITRADLQADRDRVKRDEAERREYLEAHLGEVLIYGKSHAVQELEHANQNT